MTSSERFKNLPKHIALEDTVEEVPASDPPSPKLERDTEQDFLLRHGGG